MKILIIGDLHGQKPNISFARFDVILSVGDICDTDYIRIIQFEQIQKKMKDPSYQFSPWYEIMGRRKAKQKIETSLLKARKTVEFLASFKVPVYIVPGNADLAAEPRDTWSFMKNDFWGGLIQGLDNFKNIHGKIIDLGEFRLIGYGFSYGPEYPQEKGERSFFTKEELSKKLKKYRRTITEMEGLFSSAKNPVIFLSHNVPYNTPIDRIEAIGSPRLGTHCGSLVARKMIDKYQSQVCIGGHMHEHYGKIMLKKTTCLAAGFGANANTLLETEKGKVRRISFSKIN
ncbi:MAG: metallophosphoesterase [Deltaproteobacteria bacterium]|nr:metallophosphoesterase [Deltaproteobacteria bacterium]